MSKRKYLVAVALGLTMSASAISSQACPHSKRSNSKEWNHNQSVLDIPLNKSALEVEEAHKYADKMHRRNKLLTKSEHCSVNSEDTFEKMKEKRLNKLSKLKEATQFQIECLELAENPEQAHLCKKLINKR